MVGEISPTKTNPVIFLYPLLLVAKNNPTYICRKTLERQIYEKFRTSNSAAECPYISITLSYISITLTSISVQKWIIESIILLEWAHGRIHRRAPKYNTPSNYYQISLALSCWSCGVRVLRHFLPVDPVTETDRDRDRDNHKCSLVNINWFSIKCICACVCMGAHINVVQVCPCENVCIVCACECEFANTYLKLLHR